MDSAAHTSFKANDRSYLAILKKEIHKMAVTAGFDSMKAGEIDIIVAEMASNLIKHGDGGEILAKIDKHDKNTYMELIAIDDGPGMTDPHKMMEDGMSTSNTLGHGLGAMHRLSHFFQVYSLKGWGTIVLSRIYLTKPKTAKQKADIHTLIVAKPGEELSGDGAGYDLQDSLLRLFLGDGLGHGPDAHDAVQKGVASFLASEEKSPAEMLRNMHLDVKKTRGLVGSAVTYSFTEKVWRIGGIGNIATRIQHFLLNKTYVAHNGIIGLNIPNTMKEQEIPAERGQVIIMCSDGIKTRWELQKYVGIFRYDLSILAAVIYKDFARRTDDMSVLVARINAA